MNRFEVTVGRFRKFVEQYDAWRGTGHPQIGEGAHPKAANTGWRSEFNADLPANAEALKASIKCDGMSQTWTDKPGPNETRPMNCLDWFVSFAFCAWDGGRMPTETENNYARTGGEERDYPWSEPKGQGCSSKLLGKQYASYECAIENDLGKCILDVGALSAGDGKWGQADLGGNLWEWNFDWYDALAGQCTDCAIAEPKTKDDGRFVRTINGCGWPNGSSGMCQWYRGRNEPHVRQSNQGVRCVLPP